MQEEHLQLRVQHILLANRTAKPGKSPQALDHSQHGGLGQRIVTLAQVTMADDPCKFPLLLVPVTIKLLSLLDEVVHGVLRFPVSLRVERLNSRRL